MYLGTQIKPRDDSDYRVWAQLGVNHVCVDPPGNPHRWSVDTLMRQREHVESFGLTLDMVQLPLSSRQAAGRSHTGWLPSSCANVARRRRRACCRR